MNYYMRKRGNHFYQCFMQFYIILIHTFVVWRSFKIRFCSNISDYWPFGPLTLRTIDASDYWPFGPFTLRINELTRFGENHTPSTLNTSFVDLEIEWAHCNRCKKLNFVSLSNSLSVFSVSQTSSTRYPHLPSFLCNFILNLFSSWISMNKRYIIPKGNQNGQVTQDEENKTKTQQHNVLDTTIREQTLIP